MAVEPDKSKKNFFSEWLEKLQQESWQLELLISGLALFGIWEAQNVIALYDYYVDIHATSEIRSALNVFSILFWSSWTIFLINLLIHIILRGFWIGAIGLRYVSGDIDFDELNYSDRFKNYYKKRIGSFDEYIERIERLSSVIFSFTFLLFFMLLSFIVFNLVFVFIMALIIKLIDGSEAYNAALGIFGLAYYGLGLIVLVDFFSLGAFKKIKDRTISGIYLSLYRFYSTISLSFIYRPLLLNFIDDKYTRKLFFLAIPYGLALLGMSGFFIERYTFFPSFSNNADYLTRINEQSINYHFYDDERADFHNSMRRDGDRIKKSKIYYISLDSYEQSRSEMTLFLEYKDEDEKVLNDKYPDLSPYRKKGIRHKMFGSNKEKSKDVYFDSLETVELRIARSILKKGITPTDVDSAIINKLAQYTEEEYETAREEIRSKYNDQRYNYQEERLLLIKEGLKGLYQIDIDDTSVDGMMECEFYIHPNLKERGLLCYLNIDSLTYGKHIIHVAKENHNGSRDLKIPFRKIKN